MITLEPLSEMLGMLSTQRRGISADIVTGATRDRPRYRPRGNVRRVTACEIAVAIGTGTLGGSSVPYCAPRICYSTPHNLRNGIELIIGIQIQVPRVRYLDRLDMTLDTIIPCRHRATGGVNGVRTDRQLRFQRFSAQSLRRRPTPIIQASMTPEAKVWSGQMAFIALRCIASERVRHAVNVKCRRYYVHCRIDHVSMTVNALQCQEEQMERMHR